jgi:methylenetetrahydrofolate reductase (NADPH)
MKLVSDEQPFSAHDAEATARMQALVRWASIEATPRQILAQEHLPNLLPRGTCV